jgi:2-keto-3-deoxy-L-rhamnonate aldolase RhmA
MSRELLDCPRYGLVVQVPHPQVIESLGAARATGLTFIMLDGQHEGLNMEKTPDLMRAAEAKDLAVLVRVGVDDYQRAALFLDQGAKGIVFPMVRTREQALHAVATCRYPPTGRRSLGGSRTVAPGSASEPLCIIQIEDHEGLKNADAILQVPGLDAWFPGLADMAQSLGTMATDGRAVMDVVRERVAKADMFAKQSSVARMEFCPTSNDLEQAQLNDVRLILLGMDLHFMVSGLRKRIELAVSTRPTTPAS